MYVHVVANAYANCNSSTADGEGAIWCRWLCIDCSSPGSCPMDRCVPFRTTAKPTWMIPFGRCRSTWRSYSICKARGRWINILSTRIVMLTPPVHSSSATFSIVDAQQHHQTCSTQTKSIDFHLPLLCLFVCVLLVGFEFLFLQLCVRG
jgi:hypothetical protein